MYCLVLAPFWTGYTTLSLNITKKGDGTNYIYRMLYGYSMGKYSRVIGQEWVFFGESRNAILSFIIIGMVGPILHAFVGNMIDF